MGRNQKSRLGRRDDGPVAVRMVERHGWYAAGMVDILKYLPKSHPQYNAMLTMLETSPKGLKCTRSHDGLWYQVTDKGSQSEISLNLPEAACSFSH